MPTLLSLAVPLIYIFLLLGSLYTFSTLYRRRQTSKLLSLTPYFPTHTTRNVFLTLLHTEPRPPPSILMAALQERCCTNIQRIREIQTRKGPLNTLLQRGVVGDEIWQRLLRAEKDLENELKDCVAEANTLAPGNEKEGRPPWGAHIFQSANEIVNNRLVKAKLDEVRESLEPEKSRWEEKREKSRLELEGGLKQDHDPAPPSTASSDDAVMVENPDDSRPDTPSQGAGGKKNKKKNKK